VINPNPTLTEELMRAKHSDTTRAARKRTRRK
jgi:hypothetical protein